MIVVWLFLTIQRGCLQFVIVEFPDYTHLLFLTVSKKKNSLVVGGREEKSVSRDHLLSSLGKPCDAKQRSSGWIFLSHSYTHERFLYYHIP